MIREPDVTLTDFLIGLEAIVFAVLIARSSTTASYRTWFILFFGATAAAALAGGSVHGFFPTSGPAAAGDYIVGKVLWRTVLVAIGVAALSAWAIGARLNFSTHTGGIITTAACVEFAVYAVLVMFFTDAFVAAIVNYLPATLFLIVVFLLAYRSTPSTGLAFGLAGLLLTLVAAGVQQARIALHPTYFNHNALYHVLQALALFLIFRAATFLTTATP